MRAPNAYLEPTTKGCAMPYDKPTTPRTLAPNPSHSNMRAGITTPLTPRIAGTTPSNVSTPLLRRATRPDLGMASPSWEEGTPLGNILSTNITPRSGSRKTRVNSANTTPSGTPSGTPQSEAFAGEILSYEDGSGRSNVGSPYLKPAATFSNSGRSEVGSSRGGSRSESQNDGKFFYASDVKSSPAPPIRPRPLGHKQPGLLHAKGSTSKASGSLVAGYSSGASSIGRPDEREKPKSKFFHANGTPDATLPLPSAGYSRAGSTVSSASIAQPLRLAAPQKSNGIPRSVSLQKVDNTASYFSPKLVASAQTSPVLALPPISPQVAGNRRSVQEERPEPRRMMSGHQKSQSLSQSVSKSITMMDVRSSVGSSLGSDLSSVGQSQPQHMAEILNAPVVSIPAAEIPGQEDESIDTSVIDNVTIASGLQSPLKAGANLERMNELAAEARRERKVMDLEITNSSLSAINRTLEREMRRQKAELQRYRRLSRSGRLSIIPDCSTKSRKHRQSLLSALSELGEEDGDDEENSADEDESSEDEEDLESDEAELSPAALAESDARHQKRDEQRLALDLSKHQQLLEDSQKMNQSLKKCLGWTEELIKDGKKALAYQVYAEDVKLGGRILVDDDHDDDPEHMEEYAVKEEYFVVDGPEAPTYMTHEEAETGSYGHDLSSNGNSKERPSEDFQSDP